MTITSVSATSPSTSTITPTNSSSVTDTTSTAPASSATSTTSSSSANTTTNSTDAVTAANQAAAQQLISALGAGSGVDVNALAQNLVNAERVPQENIINAKISQSQARISGYSAVSYVLSQVQTAMQALQDQNSFNTLTVNSSSSAFSVTATTAAAQGSHDVDVLSLAKAQRTVSNGFATPTDSLNGGQALNYTLTVGSGTSAVSRTVSLAAGQDTPRALADAINAANTDVSAQIVNTGDATNPYKLVLIGATGSVNGFTLTPQSPSSTASGAAPSTPVDLGLTNNQAAGDAQIKVDGVTYTRNANSFNDVLTGLTFNLNSVTTTTDASGNPVDNTAQFSLTRDTSSVQTRLQAMVSAYNDAVTIFSAVSDPQSSLATYGATLVGDSTVNSLSQQLRDMLINTSSTPGTSINALWQIGVSIDASGVMSLDSSKLNTALSGNFDDVVKTLTGDQNGLTTYSTTPGGVAGDAVRKLSQMLSSTGTIATQTNDAQSQITTYQKDLSTLNTRMASLLTRYQQQFAAMNTLVGSINSQKTSLQTSFDGMMAIYTNKNTG